MRKDVWSFVYGRVQTTFKTEEVTGSSFIDESTLRNNGQLSSQEVITGVSKTQVMLLTEEVNITNKLMFVV